MRISRYSFNSMPQMIFLGYCGENDATCIEFEMSTILKNYPNSEVRLYVKNPINDMYVAQTNIENGILKWILKTDDTVFYGNGMIEINILGKAEEVIKSATASTMIESSLSIIEEESI